jgi:hypothetical protein
MTMMIDPQAVIAARQSLAQRIARFLDWLEGEGRNPNRLEGELLLDALSHLAAFQLPRAEDLMTKAERAGAASAQELARVKPPFDPVTTRGLRTALTHILEHPGQGRIDTGTIGSGK